MSTFAHGKWALRAMAQSVAREFAPKGIHVAHAIIDGVIDIPRTKHYLKDQPPEAKISAEGVSVFGSLLICSIVYMFTYKESRLDPRVL